MKYLNLSFEESVALLQESVNLAKQAIEEEKKVNPTIGNGNSYSASFKFLIRPALLFNSSVALLKKKILRKSNKQQKLLLSKF